MCVIKQGLWLLILTSTFLCNIIAAELDGFARDDIGAAADNTDTATGLTAKVAGKYKLRRALTSTTDSENTSPWTEIGSSIAGTVVLLALIVACVICQRRRVYVTPPPVIVPHSVIVAPPVIVAPAPTPYVEGKPIWY
ncbi:hypothetical protein R1flu_016593 [Riccia fluitans]|uniref:Uncharacterized protein n=1 Tax=Riccia fluitans TaxID=41844 RepID=A0ABD1YM96_9MARC